MQEISFFGPFFFPAIFFPGARDASASKSHRFQPQRREWYVVCNLTSVGKKRTSVPLSDENHPDVLNGCMETNVRTCEHKYELHPLVSVCTTKGWDSFVGISPTYRDAIYRTWDPGPGYIS